MDHWCSLISRDESDLNMVIARPASDVKYFYEFIELNEKEAFERERDSTAILVAAVAQGTTTF